MPKVRPNAGSYSVGFSVKKVTIVDVDSVNNLAIVKDTLGSTHEIRLDITRAKGPVPLVGEVWYIDKTLGAWTFAAIVGNTSGGIATSFDFVQDISAAVWTITHNLNTFPSVTVADSANDQVTSGVVHYVSANILTVTFGSGLTGRAHLV